MDERVQVKFPTDESSDVTITVMRNGNVSTDIAKGLHEIYEGYRKESAKAGYSLEIKPFKVNDNYQFISTLPGEALGQGIVFRLLDDGARPPFIEFYIPPEFASRKGEVMMHIPGMLKEAGMDDPKIVAQVEREISNYVANRGSSRYA